MKPDYGALAALLENESIAGITQATAVAAALTSRRQAASDMVAGWIAERRGPGYSPWAVLGHEEADVYEHLAFLVRVPQSIDQGDFGHCGPASLLAILFTYFPNMMARFAKDLIMSGAGQLGSTSLQAPNVMLGVTVDDLAIAVPTEGTRRPLVPQPLDWMLMATLQYGMSKDEDDETGLQRGGATAGMVESLLTQADLVKDFDTERPLVFDLDEPILVGKKDRPLREILLTCDAAFLEGSGSKLSSNSVNHVIWLKNYAHRPPNVDLTYYTWGAFESRRYAGRTFSSHASEIISFTMKIDAAD